MSVRSANAQELGDDKLLQERALLVARCGASKDTLATRNATFLNHDGKYTSPDTPYEEQKGTLAARSIEHMHDGRLR